MGAPMDTLAMLLPLTPTDTPPTLTPMVPGTWARGLLMLSPRLMPLFSMELMAMLATPPLTPTYTLPTLTPMVATPMLMEPDMAPTPTWDKTHTSTPINNIHAELKISI